jgi:RecA-family ATPase
MSNAFLRAVNGPPQARESIDFASLMRPVAERLLGSPNKNLSRGPRLRFGSHGSVEVNTDDGWFDDYEAKVKGGVLDLIQHKAGVDLAGAFRWLEDEGLKPVEHKPGSSAPRPAPRGGPIFYDYRDEAGAVLYRVERRNAGSGSRFIQHGPDGRGGFRPAQGVMQGVRRVLYNLPTLAVADPNELVFFCEGEKDADRLCSLGLVATTNSGGAGKVTREMASPLSGRRVIVLQDNDAAGDQHVEAVLKALDGVAETAAALFLPGLPPKGDVSDWLDAGGDAATLADLAEGVLAGEAAPEPETLPLADLGLWSATKPVPKSFIMAGLVPARELTLLTGAGGCNKSTFGQQLATCVAAGLPMLGVEVCEGSALYITAEDDEDRLHWMQDHICRALGVRMETLTGKLHLGSIRGRLGNELATFDGEGKLRPSPFFHVLRSTVVATKARLVVLDNSAHLFAGNENDRQQVTAFANLIYSLCTDLGVTVILVGHTNKAGDSWSGSTAWLNAVRSQVVLERPESAIDPDVRVLRLGKANYSRQGAEMHFRWHDFALVRDDDLPADTRAALEATIASNAVNEAFLRCLRERAAQGEGRGVGPSSGPNYAPKQFEGMPQAKGLKSKALKEAMDRLFSIGAIETYEHVVPGKGRSVTLIREARTPPNGPPERFPNTGPERPRTVHPNTPANTPYTTYNGHGPSGPAAPDLSSNPALEQKPVRALGKPVF